MSTDTTDRYVLEFGVHARGERVCALEVGGFTTEEFATKFALAMDKATPEVAKSVASALDMGLTTDSYDAEPGDERLTIVGATLNVYTDKWGTDHDLTRDLY